MATQAELASILSFLLTQNESEIIEFKEAKIQFDSDKLGRYFSALSNEANLKGNRSAWLIFGIKDDKSVVGTEYRSVRSTLDNLKSEVAQHTTGRLSFVEIHELFQLEGRVILFQIPSSPKGIPTAWKGHYYGRDGDELNALNLEKLERIRTQAKVDWSATIVETATIDDLSKDAIAKGRELYKRKNNHFADEIDSWDDTTFLNKSKVCIKSKITHTAILLFGKSDSEHFINPASSKISWILRDNENNDKDYEHFTCPLVLNVEKLHQKIRNLKYRYLDHDSLFPEEVDQYDPYITREALNNCIVHQDYTLSGRINVIEHEDGKLIFINNGNFIPSSIEEVVIGDAPESIYRNPFLVEAMINMNMIDAIGSGIRRMFQIQRKKSFPLPDYELEGNKVKLTITGKIIDIEYARKCKSKDLQLVDIIILDKVSKGKKLTEDEVKKLYRK